MASKRHSPELPRTTAKAKADDPTQPISGDATEQLAPAWEPAGNDGYHRHNGEAHLHRYGDSDHFHAADGTIIFRGKHPAATDTTQPLETPPGPPPAGGWFADRVSSSADQRADPTPAGVPDPGEGSEPSAVASGEAGAGSDAAGAGLAYNPNGRRELERPGQVAASFGTSSGDVPFQAALMSVVRPAADADEARLLAEEMAHLSGFMATAGRVAAEYHAHGRLAEPGLLVALRFQVHAMLTGRGLDR
jgi:hypothetical protein